MALTDVRVQFAHGLEGSPRGRKARVLAEHFDARTPAMDTGDFEACVRLHAELAAGFDPHVLVGSSFGAAVVLALLQRGAWRGPTLLLAQAGLRRGLPARLPAGVPVWIAHASDDPVVPIQDSRELAAAGDPAHVRLLELDDDHALRTATQGGMLVQWITGLAEFSC
jgi:predicted esterase